MLCDSNVLIYAADPSDTVCLPFVQRPDALISSVTRIEVLGFPGYSLLSPDRQARLHALVSSVIEAPLDERVIRGAISLRQRWKMSLADAIIAATALDRGVPLATRNESDFQQIARLQILNPFKPRA